MKTNYNVYVITFCLWKEQSKLYIKLYKVTYNYNATKIFITRLVTPPL